MQGPTQDIVVTSEPPGATITPTDYKTWVKTPGVIVLERSQSTILTARLYGYEDQKIKVKCDVSAWLFGNAVGQFYPWTFLSVADGSIALLMLDMSTGSIGTLTPKVIHFEMEKNRELQ